MKILMLTPYLPYSLSSGGQIRSYSLIRELSKQHRIILYCLIKYEEERMYLNELRKYCESVRIFTRPKKPWTIRNILRTGLSLLPFVAIRNFSQEEKNELAKLLSRENFDIIHAETFYVSPHIPKTWIPIVLVDQTMEFEVYQHFVQNFKWWFLKPLLMVDVLKIRYWETYYWKKAARVVALSEKDAQVMRRYVPIKKVAIVPNPVSEDMLKETPLHYSKKIIFMGNYDWLQNVEAAQILVNQIFPLIKKTIPEAELIISGQNIKKIKINNQPDISIVSLAIDDTPGVVDAYHKAGVLVAPLYGPGGGRVKIIGAMAAKLPVVTTDIGIQGIEAKNGESVLFGKTPTELASLTVRLLLDKKLYTRIATNARKLAETQYSPKAIAQKMDQVYQEAANEAHS